MGISYSTKNYEKIINILEEPYLDNLRSINPNLVEAINIDNNNRKLVYKHNTRDVYLLYIGGICNVSQCFEVNENFLLRESHQFSTFYTLKDFVIRNYPKSELVLEIIKYESKHYIDIIDLLERGDHKEIIINFSDSDSDDSSWSDVYVDDDPTEFNPSWSDMDDSKEIKEKEEKKNESSPSNCSPVWSNIEDNKDINNFNAVWSEGNSNNIFNYCPSWCDTENTLEGKNTGWIYNNEINTDFNTKWSSVINKNFKNINDTSLSQYYNNVTDCLKKGDFLNKCLDDAVKVSTEAETYADYIADESQKRILNKCVDTAVDVCKESAEYSYKIVNECNKIIESINNYEKNYLDMIEEEINNSDDSSDEDIIFPNLNYFKHDPVFYDEFRND